MARHRRIQLLAVSALAGGVLAGIAALIDRSLALALIGALLTPLIVIARDGRNRVVALGKRVHQLEREHHQASAELDRVVRTSLDEGLRVLEAQMSRAVSLVQTMHGSHLRQMQATTGLHALFDMRALVPLTDDFTALPDLLHRYVTEILSRPVSLVVECGSGLSTLWAAYALERNGGGGRVVALEHDEGYALRTRAIIAAHGLSERAEVRHAPIRQVTLADRQCPWYDVTQVVDLVDIDILFVDGPVGTLAPHSRYPALPILRERLRPGAVVLLDDAKRPEECDIVEWWSKEWPELDLERLPHERGTALWRVPQVED